MRNAITAVALGLLGSLTAVASQDSCLKPGRDRKLCLSMKHLKAHLGLLDSQRELLRVDFEFLDAVSSSLEQASAQILASSNGDPHIAQLNSVRTTALEASALARKKSLSALTVTNSIRSKCLTCHAPTNPSSGHSWEEISANDWSVIAPRCNESGRNPYVCKSMYALLTNVGFFESSERAGKQDFGTTETVAREIQRIASELVLKDFMHGSPPFPMNEVLERSRQIQELAQAKDPAAFESASQMRQACIQCHGERLAPVPLGVRDFKAWIDSH